MQSCKRTYLSAVVSAEQRAVCHSMGSHFKLSHPRHEQCSRSRQVCVRQLQRGVQSSPVFVYSKVISPLCSAIRSKHMALQCASDPNTWLYSAHQTDGCQSTRCTQYAPNTTRIAHTHCTFVESTAVHAVRSASVTSTLQPPRLPDHKRTHIP
jgi:hypothetical protein